jgi:hypothetical protein
MDNDQAGVQKSRSIKVNQGQSRSIKVDKGKEYCFVRIRRQKPSERLVSLTNHSIERKETEATKGEIAHCSACSVHSF